MKNIFFTYETLSNTSTGIYWEQYTTNLDIYNNSILQRLVNNGIIKIIPKIWLEKYKNTLPNFSTQELEYTFSWRELWCIQYNDTIISWIEMYNTIDKVLSIFNPRVLTIEETMQFIEENLNLQIDWNELTYNYFDWTENTFTLLIQEYVG